MIIRQVPTGDTNEEISLALSKNGYKIRQVHRFSILKGTVKSPSTTVALEFEGPPPKRNFPERHGLQTREESHNTLQMQKIPKIRSHVSALTPRNAQTVAPPTTT